MKATLITFALLIIADLAFSQGSIDIDTNIQMGVVGTEHVKINSSAFSVHNGAGTTPLIYGDFGSGNVGIGTSNSNAKLDIQQIGNGWNDGLRINRDATNYLTLTEDVTDIRLKNWGSGGIKFFTSTLEALTIQNDGNVSIGNNLTVAKQVNINKNNPNNLVGAKAELRFSGNYYSGAIALENTASNPGYLNPKLAFRLQNLQTYQAWDVIERMTILSNGRVGINRTNPSYTLDVNGSIRYSSGGLNGSDRRWKKEINQIESATSVINKINPISYLWRTEEFPDSNFDSRKHYGVIAQELEETLPELVDTDNEGFKSVDYTSLIAILVRAAQEKDEEIDELRALNAEVKIQNEGLRSEIETKVDLLQSQIDQIINQYETSHSVPIVIGSGNLTGSKQ